MANMKMKKNKFPKGWDEERVLRVIAHYEEQSELESIAEDDTVYDVLVEVMEDLALARAIEEGEPTDPVSKEEVLKKL